MIEEKCLGHTSVSDTRTGSQKKPANSAGFFLWRIFSLIAYALFFSQLSIANFEYCEPPGVLETAVVAHIYDGDTLRLQDGRRVRLLGINTPEIGRGNKVDEPFAKAARQVLESLLGDRRKIELFFDDELKDRHGRYLAHVYVRGRGVERELLQRGLAYHVAVPPNLTLAKCFDEEEQRARNARLGLWSASGIEPGPSTEITEGGYRRFYGKVERVALADAWWIELEGDVTAVIYPEHQHRFKPELIAAWKGKQLKLEGWVYRAKGRKGWRVKLETPYALTLMK